MKKAYDMVTQQPLMAKPANYGVRGPMLDFL